MNKVLQLQSIEEVLTYNVLVTKTAFSNCNTKLNNTTPADILVTSKENIASQNGIVSIIIHKLFNYSSDKAFIRTLITPWITTTTTASPREISKDLKVHSHSIEI